MFVNSLWKEDYHNSDPDLMWSKKLLKKIKNSQWAGFEPARGDPIGFQVQRLNHLAITACVCKISVSHDIYKALLYQ